MLKDILINKEKIEHLAEIIKKAHPKFPKKQFIKSVITQIKTLELKQRITCVTNNLHSYLDLPYNKAVDILLGSLKYNSLKNEFIFASYSEYAATYGCTNEYFKKSLVALSQFTIIFSSEEAIRFFINKFPEETYKFLSKLAKSKDADQRRLVSEGLRPTLPWAKKINFSYKKGAKLLDYLYYDTSRYVTRSVANHLNDISKFDKVFVLKILKKWLKEKKQNTKEFTYICNHSLRTLIKNGDKDALKFIGYDENIKIKLNNIKLANKKINLGDNLVLSFNLTALEDVNLLIDYIIFFQEKQEIYSKNISTKKNKFKEE